MELYTDKNGELVWIGNEEEVKYLSELYGPKWESQGKPNTTPKKKSRKRNKIAKNSRKKNL